MSRALLTYFHHSGDASDDELRAVIAALGTRTTGQQDKLIRRYRADVKPRIIASDGYQRQPEWGATPGRPDMGEPQYRSQWEKRAAKALDRIGLRYSYECERFVYQGALGRYHRYTPDFRLDDFTNVFVEIKGWEGPDSVDELKMQRVIRRYPKLTLLLWDADIVEYVEDVPDASYIVPLLTTTRLAA